MYGMHVHEAVLASGEHESGITIQYINEHYDQGDIIFRRNVPFYPMIPSKPLLSACMHWNTHTIHK